MRVRLDYGIDGLEAELPDERVTVIELSTPPAVRDPVHALRTALRAPVAGPPLSDIARGARSVAIAVCDVTRAQPRREMVHALLAEMSARYQAVKGMSAAARVVKRGGTIICAAECRDGFPAHGAYGRILASQPTPARLLTMIRQPGYAVPDQWQAQIQAQIQSVARVLVKTEGLSPAELRAAHFEPADDVAAAVRDALREAGPAATLCVLPQGPQTIPCLTAAAVAPAGTPPV